MDAISVFDMFKIGIGPSSSHTLGPWRAVQRFLRQLDSDHTLASVKRLRFHLFGSLALTGKGHATDRAVCLALLGHEPDTIDTAKVAAYLGQLAQTGEVMLGAPAAATAHRVPFDPKTDIVFHPDQRHPGHANAIGCWALLDSGREVEATYFSIGGGFITHATTDSGRAGPAELDSERVTPAHPVRSAADILAHCERLAVDIPTLVRLNERAWFTDRQIDDRAAAIWHTMRACAHRGCMTSGVLPGGLNVTRRAARFALDLLPVGIDPDPAQWIKDIRAEAHSRGAWSFERVLQWVSCFALAVNEENAAMGRVVTAPTNGAAGVIPAVLLYRAAFGPESMSDARATDFLLVAGVVGALFKRNATISAAMGGCQAEIGVSSAMAAAAITHDMGGNPARCLMAAEIAMEHHLGMTCDPVAGLVQVPCIERNSMGAVKAINAAVLAMESDPAMARVSLDDVIKTMWETALEMREKYKETSQGGLAVNISVRVSEC